MTSDAGEVPPSEHAAADDVPEDDVPEDDVPGMVRRARRRLGVSQRGLATLLDVSQSVVSRWETGRVSPRAAMLQRLLTLAGVEMSFHQDDGTSVPPMRSDGARDRGGRRYPAHVDLRASQWWTPPGSHMTNDHYRWIRMERDLRRPRVEFRVAPWRRDALRLAFGSPDDHASLEELREEVEAWEERRWPAQRATLEHLERVRLAAVRARELDDDEAETRAGDDEYED